MLLFIWEILRVLDYVRYCVRSQGKKNEVAVPPAYGSRKMRHESDGRAGVVVTMIVKNKSYGVLRKLRR